MFKALLLKAAFVALSLLLSTSVTVSSSSKFTTPPSIPQCLGLPDITSPTCFSTGSKSPTRSITLVISEVTLPGYPKPVVTINGTYPGPTLEMNQFDVVTFTVINNLPGPTSLHFHGARQYRTPHLDGVPGITQCPIQPNTTLVYTWCTDRSGTFWYHGHYNEDYPDGLYGAMIVHSYPQDIYQPQYQYDIPIVVADFYNAQAASLIPWFLSPASFGSEPVPNSYIVNGKFSQQLAYAIPNNAQVRLRFVCATALSNFNISIDGYTMTIIEIDGVDVYPYEVSSFPINIAQRVSVLVNFGDTSYDPWTAKQNAVYLRMKGNQYNVYDTDLVLPGFNYNLLVPFYLCGSTNADISVPSLKTVCSTMMQPTGLAQQTSPSQNYPLMNFMKPAYTLTAYTTAQYNTGIFVNAPNSIISVNMNELSPLYPGYENSNSASCHYEFYSDITMPTYTLPLTMSFQTNVYDVNLGYWNGQTLDMMQQYANPYSAPLATPLSFLHQLIQQNAPALQSNIMNPASNLMSVPDPTTLDVNLAFDPTQPSLSPVDNTTSLQLINGNSLNQYVLPPNSTIEILLINTDGNTHPIHLHGYAFWIVETSDYTPTNPTTPGTYPNWILRDIVTLPGNGWAKIRLVTDNPGAWILHCHISWHLEAGLAVVLVDNLEALQNDPYFSYSSLIPQDHQSQCQHYMPVQPAVQTTPCVKLVENDFKFVLTAATQAPWIIISDCIIVSEALIGLVLYKLNVLNIALPELIGMNVGTLIGAVFIELIKETYEGVYVDMTLSYLNVTIIMCIGFLFPFTMEKFIKKGRTNKFKMLTQGGPGSPQQKTDDESKSNQAESSTKKEETSDFKSIGDKSTRDHRLSTVDNTSNATIQVQLERMDSSVELAPSRLERTSSEYELTSPAASVDSSSSSSSASVSHHVNQPSVGVVTFHMMNNTKEDIAAVSTHVAESEIKPLKSSDSVSPSMSPVNTASTTVEINDNNTTKKIVAADQDTNDGGVTKRKAGSKEHRGSGMEKIALMLSSNQVDWNLIFIILMGEVIDNFVDGGTIAAAYLASDAAGLATSIGVFMEELPHLTGSFAVFVAAGAPLWKCVLINMAASCGFLCGSAFILGIVSAPNVNPAQIRYLLPFAVGSYLYVALVDLTPVLTNMPWTGYARALTCLGSVLFGFGIQAAVNVYDWKEGTS